MYAAGTKVRLLPSMDTGDLAGEIATVVDNPPLAGIPSLVTVTLAEDLTDDSAWHLFMTSDVEPVE
jgi:hypothetical protein